MPPAEPPPHLTEVGLAFAASTRSLSVWYGESARTTTTSASAVSVAIGVVLVRSTGDLLVTTPPTITSPVTISWCALPLWLLTSSASPMVPAAPVTLRTSADCPLRRFASWSAFCIDRAVVSQPPPAAAGAMICSVLLG